MKKESFPYEQVIVKCVKVSSGCLNEIKVNGYNINYFQAGSGPPVLLLHGSSIGWGQWYKNIEQLSKYFTVYAMDLPYSGGSTKLDLNKKVDLYNIFVKTVDDFITELQLDNISIISHSFSGWIAGELAINVKNYNIGKIIFVDPMGFTTYSPFKYKLLSVKILRKLITKFFVPFTYAGMKDFLGSVMFVKDNLEVQFSDYFFESVNRKIKIHPLDFMANFLIHKFKINPVIDLTDRLDKIDASCLFIMGKYDPLIPYEKVFLGGKHISKHSIKLYNNTGHVPFNENYKKFNRDILDFLK